MTPAAERGIGPGPTAQARKLPPARPEPTLVDGIRVEDEPYGLSAQAPLGALPPVLLSRLQAQIGNRALTGLVVQRRELTEPGADPKFRTLTADVHRKRRRLSAHPPARSEAAKAQGAAKAPPDDKIARGKAAQADKMAAAKPGGFDQAAFIAAVNSAIDQQAPKNLSEARDYGSSGKADAIKGQVAGKVTAGKKAAAAAIETTTKTPPSTAGIATKPVTPLAPDRPPGTPGTPNPALAVPDKAPPGDTDFSAGPKQVDGEMADAGVTEEQLARSNEPEFTGALAAKKEGEEHSATAPGQLRASEAQTRTAARADAAATGGKSMAAMAMVRRVLGGSVAQGKQATKGSEESKREKVAAVLQKVFDATKADVEGILNGIDARVDTAFSAGEKAARDTFTAEHTQKMDDYKRRRYKGWRGKLRWVRDKFKGLPREAFTIFDVARRGYVARMKQVIAIVARVIATELDRAKARILQGRRELQTEVTKLPKDLRALGKQAAREFGDKFDELADSVDSKGNELVQTLASKYKDALGKVDEEIEAEKEKNSGLIARAINAVKGVIKAILELKDLLLNVLAKAAQAAWAIISDPIGFLGNLVSGVGDGLQAFLSHIDDHLRRGLLGWLMGSASALGVEIPEKLDFRGVLTMIAGMAGLNWESIKARVMARGVPAQAIELAEGSLPMIGKLRSEGLTGVADEILARTGDLTENLFDKITGYLVPEVLRGGIMFIASLLNPASAFIKACKMIVDIVSFILTKGKLVLEFVDAVLDAVIAIASGAASGVATAIENALAKSIPALIGMLAAILGVSGIADKIKQFIQSLAKPVNRAVDWLADQVVRAGRAAWGRVKAVGARAKAAVVAAGGKIKTRVTEVGDRLTGKDRRSDQQKRLDLDAGLDEADGLVTAKLPEHEIRRLLPEIRVRYRMRSLELIVDAVGASEEQVHVAGEVNPTATRAQKTIPKPSVPYVVTDRRPGQLWRDCILKNRFSAGETPAEAADRVGKARQALIARGLLADKLDAMLAHNEGLDPRPFVSVVAEDGYGGHTVSKHVRGGAVADEAALATRILLGVPAPRPVDVASFFTSEEEATTAVGLVIDTRLKAQWRDHYREHLASHAGTEFTVPLPNVGHGLRIDPAVAQPNDKPSYLPGGTYQGPMYPGDPRAANPVLPPMTVAVPLAGVLVTITADSTAPGGWYVLRAFPVV